MSTGSFERKGILPGGCLQPPPKHGLKKLVIHTSSYGYLAKELVANNPESFELLKFERKRFADGERYHRLLQKVRGRDVVVVGGTIDEKETMELYFLSTMVWRYKAHSITAILPYFGYSTMERAVKFGEDVKAKDIAVMLSSLPKPPGGLTFVMLDLHAEGIVDYFENGVWTEHLYAKQFVLDGIAQSVAEAGSPAKVNIGTTDGGRLKWADSLAKEAGVGLAIVLKRRLSGTKTERMAVQGDVAGVDIDIFDDMIRTGGSLVESGKGYREGKSRKHRVRATHGVLPGKAIERLMGATDESGEKLFEHVYVTNSHPRAVRLAKKYPQFLTAVSITPLLADYLINGHPLERGVS